MRLELGVPEKRGDSCRFIQKSTNCNNGHVLANSTNGPKFILAIVCLGATLAALAVVLVLAHLLFLCTVEIGTGRSAGRFRILFTGPNLLLSGAYVSLASFFAISSFSHCNKDILKLYSKPSVYTAFRYLLYLSPLLSSTAFFVEFLPLSPRENYLLYVVSATIPGSVTISLDTFLTYSFICHIVNYGLASNACLGIALVAFITQNIAFIMTPVTAGSEIQFYLSNAVFDLMLFLAAVMYLFQEGVMVAKKDFNLPKHNEVDVPNLHVIKALQSLESRGLVNTRFSWQYYYYFLNDAGIEYLRKFLHLPVEIVPRTHIKTAKPAGIRPGREERPQRERREGGDGYRRRNDGEKKEGASGDFRPEFRGGVGRGGPRPAQE
ncbi:hypothetical protein CcCBS67573_g05812 [Chytriomyces confervae]|uniref:Plectin/eS10 N-terminal domain-containing protein n=1 Tax=Chytriomyces confervae TaxID=246404 RepID=A0A507FB12_9FUNG|nr:hypothetical protein CcCBS67573_g05812 [Chytriomyces confervae]